MTLLIFPLAYLLGSIPSSVWLGKLFRGMDLREHGSGNAGATNAFRVLGLPLGIAVLVLDILKGYLAVNLVHLQGNIIPGREAWMILRVTLGMVAVAGHIFPLFAGFRGGKGVATLAGAGLAIHPAAALAAMAVYLVVFLIFRLSALGSLSAVLTYPVWVIAVFQTDSWAVRGFSIAVPILVMITHRANIRRLVSGREKPIGKGTSGNR